MNAALHHIRLLAGFEISPESLTERLLTRDQAAALATVLADDLARTVPGLDSAVLIVAGCLLEPAEMLRPRLPVWQALVDLGAPAVREQHAGSRVFAVGSHNGRLPDARLMPPKGLPQGRFIGLPLLLAVEAESGPGLSERLEETLFETGSLAPPARALLERFTGAESVHGQLLTVNDLLALHHVQMDAAGFSAFWPVVEQVLMAPDEVADFALPTGLSVHWSGPEQQLDIDFKILDDCPDGVQAYLHWQRAFRMLTSLAAAHGLNWAPRVGDHLRLDETGQILVHDAGPIQAADSLTEQTDAGVGLIAWTAVENGVLRHLYPLSAASIPWQRDQLRARFEHIHRPAQLCHAGTPPRLQPA